MAEKFFMCSKYLFFILIGDMDSTETLEKNHVLYPQSQSLDA